MLSNRFNRLFDFCFQVLHKYLFYVILLVRHNLIFGQTMGEVFLFLVKTHSLFWLSLVVCQKLCRSKRSYAFFGVCNFGCTHFFVFGGKNMKRLISFVLCVVTVALFVTGCSNNNNQKPNLETCYNCGDQYISNSNFCSKCGADLESHRIDNGNDSNTNIHVDYTILDSGICNSNISWEIRSDGTLYIFGTGAIPNYERFEVNGQIAPWKATAVCSEITDVLIGDGITGVGEDAFYNMWLSSITFGHNVIAYDYTGGSSYFVKTAYIPATMKDIRLFLTDTATQNMTIYYEGTQEEWQTKTMAHFYGEYNNYDIHYNYEY